MSYRSIHRLLVLAATAVAALGARAAFAHDAPSVRIDTGALSGRYLAQSNVDAYLGIPYAQPPVGALRWKPPRPPLPWRGVRTADRFGPRCMQLRLYGDMVFRSHGMSEDCLDLNVWTPPHAAHAKLPVLVYFFGGGFAAGDGSEPRYDGASLARRGIVTVTVNYRLGVFGFLALPALAAESPHHAAGNYGLLDQVAALEWVHHNIAAFGGDPDEITIGGESAGAISVSALMASPLSKGLVQRAIGESGAMLGNLAPWSLARAERRGEAFEQRVGVHSLAALRALPAKRLLAATAHPETLTFFPDIDGWFLRQRPASTYATGEQANIPLLLGSNSQEGSWTYLLDGQPATPANYRTAVGRLFGVHAPAVLKLYPGHTRAEVETSGTALESDDFIAFATWRWMDLQRATGHAPVYYYYFTQPRPATRDGSRGPGTGAVHSGEIEFALGNLATNHVYAWTATDYKVSATMEGYFAHFIKTGNPNGAGLPVWPPVAPHGDAITRQQIGADTHTIVDHHADRYALLRQILTPHDPR